jgi:hypothetical protein
MQHLYLGVQPMGPFVNQSHGVLTSPAHLKAFGDWAPLFIALRGKQWFLSADAVVVRAPSSAKANMFAVGSSRYAIAVVAGDGTSTTLVVGALSGVAWKEVTALALLPGAAAPIALELHEVAGGSASLTTPPLPRGSVLCVLKVAPASA